MTSWNPRKYRFHPIPMARRPEMICDVFTVAQKMEETPRPILRVATWRILTCRTPTARQSEDVAPQHSVSVLMRESLPVLPTGDGRLCLPPVDANMYMDMAL